MGVGMPFGFAIFDQSIAGRVHVSLCFFGTDREPDREWDGGGWLCAILRRHLAVSSASPGNVGKKRCGRSLGESRPPRTRSGDGEGWGRDRGRVAPCLSV
jgi:hypothetical protein